MAVIGFAILVRDHPHDITALHFRCEAAANAAVRASGDDAVLALPLGNDRFLDQRCRGASLNASAARNAFGIEKLLAPGRNFRSKAPAINGQRKGTLHLFACPYATRTENALARIEREIRIRFILLGVLKMIQALQSVATLAQAHNSGHVLEFAISIRGAGEAV